MTQDLIKTLMNYNTKNGKMYWKINKPPRGIKGNEVGYKNLSGYYITSIDGKRYLVHRLIWLYVYGNMPKMIDHIDHDTTNNKINNLREADYCINQKNLKKMATNKSGVTGVSFCNTYKKWRATIWNKNKQIRLGYFHIKDEAIKARKEAEKIYGYHPNHGV